MSAPEETGDDPYLAHFHRDPLPGGGVRIILVTEQPEETAASHLAPLVAWLEAAGRPSETRTVVFDRRTGRLDASIRQALQGTEHPLVLITTAVEPLDRGSSGTTARGDRPLRPRDRPQAGRTGGPGPPLAGQPASAADLRGSSS